ncbi:MAG: hypothetical protein V1661_02230 [bacterium]
MSSFKRTLLDVLVFILFVLVFFCGFTALVQLCKIFIYGLTAKAMGYFMLFASASTLLFHLTQRLLQYRRRGEDKNDGQ